MSFFGQPSEAHSDNQPIAAARTARKASVPLARSKAGRTRIRPDQQLMDTAEIRELANNPENGKARRIAVKIVDADASPSAAAGSMPGSDSGSMSGDSWNELNIIATDSAENTETFSSSDEYLRNQAYCRRARKVRADHAQNPRRMHRELSALSAEESSGSDRKSNPEFHNSQPGTIGAMPAPKVHTIDPREAGGAKHGFAQKVILMLRTRRNGILRYSERVALLRDAGQQGIGRFEANLIIASVQHQVQLAKSQEPSKKPQMFSNVLAGIALQGLIAWGIYRSMK